MSLALRRRTRNLARRAVAALRRSRTSGTAVGHRGRDDLRYLFIITYGRSGSTLLQGILDSIPGYLIRGENRSSLFRLFQYQSVLVNAKKAWSKGDSTLDASDAWFGIDEYDADAALAGLRAVVLASLLRPEPDTRVTGFKEIRWWHDDWRGYLDFLRAVFPGARFVINVRDHDAVAKSKWWAENPDALARLGTYEARLDEMAAYLGSSVYRLNYDEFVADHEVLAGLFEWLDEPFDRARVDATMEIRHSS